MGGQEGEERGGGEGNTEEERVSRFPNPKLILFIRLAHPTANASHLARLPGSQSGLVVQRRPASAHFVCNVVER